jgi:tyrosyl-tRNA synthetase
VQLGGADQWSNILGGVDLIRRVRGAGAYALTMPLLTTGAGEKMGKTAAGETIWLDATKTPPFAFYQYWLNTPDGDVERGFLRFTFLAPTEIAGVLPGHPRAAQHRLAFEVTELVHGEAAARRAHEDALRAFSGPELPDAVPTLIVAAHRLQTPMPVADLLVEGGAVPSRAAARRLITQGAVRANDRRVEGAGQVLTLADCPRREGRRAVTLRYGKGKVLHVLIAEEPPART